MKFLAVVGLLCMVVLAGSVVAGLYLEKTGRAYEKRLVGALRFLETHIEESSVNVERADVFHSPTMDVRDDPNVLEVTGLASLEDVAGQEYSERYTAVVTNLCEAYLESDCWRLESLTIGDAAGFSVATLGSGETATAAAAGAGEETPELAASPSEDEAESAPADVPAAAEETDTDADMDAMTAAPEALPAAPQDLIDGEPSGLESEPDADIPTAIAASASEAPEGQAVAPSAPAVASLEDTGSVAPADMEPLAEAALAAASLEDTGNAVPADMEPPAEASPGEDPAQSMAEELPPEEPDYAEDVGENGEIAAEEATRLSNAVEEEASESEAAYSQPDSPESSAPDEIADVADVAEAAEDAIHFSCRKDVRLRQVFVRFEGAAGGMPCAVVYRKNPPEGDSETTMWRANYERGYCEFRAKEFVQKLEEANWTCGPSQESDQSSG